jgi:hypothetical protein
MMLLEPRYAVNTEIQDSEGISIVNPKDMPTGVNYRIII